MSMVCPQCQGTFHQALKCPNCKVRLLFHAESLSAEREVDPLPEGQWQQTPWGRIIVGLILAQGLSLGLQQLLTACWLVGGENGAQAVWATAWGLGLLHILHALGLLAGGTLAGAGQSRGMLYGAFVGLMNGLIFLVVHRQAADVLYDIALYGQPFLHLSIGALAGFLGQRIWKPAPQIRLEGTADASPLPSRRRQSQWLAGPVHLGRIFLGISLVVGGVVSANRILDMIVEVSQGKLGLNSHLQARLVVWEIAALVIVAGAGFAGATTLNGLKQGLCVGVGSALVFLGIQLGNSRANLETILFMMMSMIGLGLAGGWFGGQLFPPVARARKRNRILTG